MLALQLEIFLLIALGYGLYKKGFIDEPMRKKLTDLTLSLILPCAIIQSFELDLTPSQRNACVFVFLASLGVQALYMVCNRFLWKKESANKRICLQYATLVSNAGFFGMPIAQAAFGEIGLLFASIFLIPQRVVMWSAGLSLFAGSTHWKQTVRQVCTHPCIVALALGLAVLGLRTIGVELPEPLDLTIRAIAACNTPICMFVIGALLAHAKKSDIFSKTIMTYSVVRLLVLPAVVFLLFRFLPMDPLVMKICVLESAMPAASTTAMLAARYDKEPAFASQLIFASTALSLLTLPAWSWLLTSL
ncbi:AEC family transporter [uncultured Dubosiella sp.]|uniref:AEC family transporter n=1 Tax=uncultured Dubosiella sp. TaxID=1937011 RepID=UPI00259B72C5|nr:AEC family transporter [uncultured Dubosiella sp.]